MSHRKRTDRLDAPRQRPELNHDRESRDITYRVTHNHDRLERRQRKGEPDDEYQARVERNRQIREHVGLFEFRCHAPMGTWTAADVYRVLTALRDRLPTDPDDEDAIEPTPEFSWSRSLTISGRRGHYTRISFSGEGGYHIELYVLPAIVSDSMFLEMAFARDEADWRLSTDGFFPPSVKPKPEIVRPAPNPGYLRVVTTVGGTR